MSPTNTWHSSTATNLGHLPVGEKPKNDLASGSMFNVISNCSDPNLAVKKASKDSMDKSLAELCNRALVALKVKVTNIAQVDNDGCSKQRCHDRSLPLRSKLRRKPKCSGKNFWKAVLHRFQ